MTLQAPERAQEIHLFPLLVKEFPTMAKSYRENLSALSTFGTENPYICWYEDDSGNLFFRFNLDMPALFILSEPLSRFQAYKRYIIPINEERKFYADLGLIPAYFANLNRVSCINLWGTQASRFFAPYSQPLRGEEDIVWRLDPEASGPAQFSSMNFILKQKSIENEIPAPIRNALSDYFKYAFWSFPRPGFGCNAHVIHSRESIKHILKVAKSLYFINRIHEPRVERLAPYYSAWVQRVELGTINRRGEFITFWTYVARDVVQKIKDEVAAEDYGKLVINGLVYEFKDKVDRPSGGLRLLSVVADFLPTDVDVFKSLAGLSAVERFHLDPETLGPIGSVSDLRAQVERRYSHFERRIPYTVSLFDRIGRPFEFIIDELFPLLVKDGHLVFFVHPIILSALLKLGMECVIQEKDTVALVNFIRLLEKLRAERRGRVRFTDEAEYFRKLGIDFPSLLSVLVSTICGIQLSKLLCKHF